MKRRAWIFLAGLFLLPLGCRVTDKDLAGEWVGDMTVTGNPSPMMQALLHDPLQVVLELEDGENGINRFTLKHASIPVATGTWIIRENLVYLNPTKIQTLEGLNPEKEALEWVYKPESSDKLVLVSPAPNEAKAPRAFTR